MTEEEKKTLVDAVNCKYPHQNLTEIYYNIGRALPLLLKDSLTEEFQTGIVISMWRLYE